MHPCLTPANTIQLMTRCANDYSPAHCLHLCPLPGLDEPKKGPPILLPAGGPWLGRGCSHAIAHAFTKGAQTQNHATEVIHTSPLGCCSTTAVQQGLAYSQPCLECVASPDIPTTVLCRRQISEPSPRRRPPLLSANYRPLDFPDTARPVNG